MTTAPTYPPEDIAQLATYIRGRHEETLGSTRNALTMAMAAGDGLIAAKKMVPHGEWERWCREVCGVSERVCQTYMTLAKNRAAIEAKAQSSALSIDAALRFLRASRRTARKTTQNCTSSHAAPAALSQKVLASLKKGLSLANDGIGNEHEITSAMRAINRLLSAHKFDLHDLKITVIARSGARGQAA
jgi:hypothetical protein